MSKKKKHMTGFAPIDFHLAGRVLFILGVTSTILKGIDYLFGWLNFPNNIFILGLISLFVSIYLIFVVPKEEV
ncbi:hypothetical protein ACFL25_00020 [Patescibacteria group bacterium]